MWGTVPDWIAACAGIGTVVVAIILAVELRDRETTQALNDLHKSLTTGETALARGTLGTLMYSRKYRHTVGELEAIDAYFRLIWAVQHARNTFRLYRLDWSRRLGGESTRIDGSRRSRRVAAALTWNLREIEQNIIAFHEKYANRWEIQDEDAWTELVRTIGIGAA